MDFSQLRPFLPRLRRVHLVGLLGDLRGTTLRGPGAWGGGRHLRAQGRAEPRSRGAGVDSMGFQGMGQYLQGGAPKRYKLVYKAHYITIDISPTKTIVKLELCSPT